MASSTATRLVDSERAARSRAARARGRRRGPRRRLARTERGRIGHTGGGRHRAGVELSSPHRVVALERARWRRPRVLLAAAAFALLAADLQWSSAHAVWTLGFLLDGLWAALLVQVVLTFPEGRPWSRAAAITIAGAYVATIGGQTAGALRSRFARPALSLRPAGGGRCDRPGPGRPRHCRRSRAARPRRATPAQPARTGPARTGPSARGRRSHGSGRRALAGLAERDRRRRLEARHGRPLRRAARSARPRGGRVLVAPSSVGGVRPRRRAAHGGSDQPARAPRARARRPDGRARLSARRGPLCGCHGGADGPAQRRRPRDHCS